MLLLTVVYLAMVPGLGLLIYDYRPFSVPSGSMKPALLPGDHLFAARHPYGLLWNKQLPRRGDIAIFHLTGSPRVDYIKRVVAVAGDSVAMRDGVLFVNGEPVELTQAGTFQSEPEEKPVALIRETLPNGIRYGVIDSVKGSLGDDYPETTVPDGHFFALGDNRDNSLDSRFEQVGPIPVENLVGRAEFIYFNVGRKPFLSRMWLVPERSAQ